jgi:hypothetical protein
MEATRPVVSPEEAAQEPYPYVYVQDDGSIRELDKSEREYLETPFFGSDTGCKPYVKSDYFQTNPDGLIRGFCHRNDLPNKVVLKFRVTIARVANRLGIR